MFFGGLFTGFVVYRFTDPRAFALASRQLDILMGTINTFVLLTSSLTMALAVRAGQEGDRKGQVRYLLLTMLRRPSSSGSRRASTTRSTRSTWSPAPRSAPRGCTCRRTRRRSWSSSRSSFFVFYFFMTGLHALHMVIGLGVMAAMVVLANRGRFTPDYYTPLEMTGLYWHFVDLVWVFLFPLLYLVELHK